MKKSFLLSVVIGLAMAAGPAAGANPMPKWGHVADGVIDDYETALTTEGVVGGAVTVFDANGSVYSRNFGMRDRAARRAVDDDTLFHWASVTKVFTSIAVMQLVERGKISLDDPVTRYVPEFKQVHNPFGSADEISIRQLLTHSAGLRGPSWPWNADGAEERAEWQPLEPAQWDQIAAMFPYTEVEFAPGSRTSYSNLGLLIAGEIVARVSGDSLETYVDKNVLRPLGMFHSFFDATPWVLVNERTHDYIVADGHTVDQGALLDSGATAPNGGLNGTVGDMRLFVKFLMGAKDSYPILRRDTLEAMFEPAYELQRDDRRTVYVGLGFFVSDERDASGQNHRYVGHSGFQRGNRSAISFSRDGCCAFVFAANTVRRRAGNASASALRIALADRLFPIMRARKDR